jgi:hypothetical protein
MARVAGTTRPARCGSAVLSRCRVGAGDGHRRRCRPAPPSWVWGLPYPSIPNGLDKPFGRECRDRDGRPGTLRRAARPARPDVLERGRGRRAPDTRPPRAAPGRRAAGLADRPAGGAGLAGRGVPGRSPGRARGSHAPERPVVLPGAACAATSSTSTSIAPWSADSHARESKAGSFADEMTTS